MTKEQAPYLTKVEVNQLLDVYRGSDPVAAKRAGNTLLVSYAPLIKKIAHRFSRKELADFDDLVQECSIGFLYALRKYDPKKGTTLATYAWKWLLAFAGKNNAHVSRLRKREVKYAVVEEATPTLGREGLDRMEQVPDESPGTAELFLALERRQEVQKAIEHWVKHLGIADRDILLRRLGRLEPATLEELSVEHGMTRQGVQQREVRLIRKLRGDVKLRRANAL